jgi:N-acetylglucosamine-6-phosphate deacetylase
LAPELEHMQAVIKSLTEQGFTVQLGHSAATYDETVNALHAGARSFTHLFNAMSGFHHREPGMAGAALAHARYSEFIPDLKHVHPGAIKAALRCIPCAYSVTDATSASGMPDGHYQLGTQSVEKCLGAVRLADGTLAGSALTMDIAFKNLVEHLGLSLYEAVVRTSSYACDLLRINDRGRLEPKAIADIVQLNHDLSIEQVWLQGQLLEPETVG